MKYFIIIVLLVVQLKAERMQFPDNFLWGVATSAHQIEGYNENSDWWFWEHQEGKIAKDEVSGAATDHWNRLEQDTQLIKDLGVRMYRFSIEWAKIEPQRGKIDYLALKHYKKEIDLLIAAGITPMLTLHHFTHPQWFMEMGAWENPESTELFLNYTKLVYENLGEELNWIITFNEPMVFITVGWGAGLFPPGKTDTQATMVAAHGVLKAHAKAYHYLKAAAKQKNRTLKVGFAHHLRVFEAYRWWHPIDHIIANVSHRFFNNSFLKAIETGVYRVNLPIIGTYKAKVDGLKFSQDFLGLNYYSRDMIKFNASDPNGFEPIPNPKGDHTDLGWEIYPEGLSKVARSLNERFPGLPMIITENGIADHKDLKRSEFIYLHLKEIWQMIQEGLPIEGYMYWSLLDNFEWIEGFEPRFGLYEVDYKNFERKLRPSGEYYKAIARQNALTTPK
ncbi:MAG: family 1 glycosylhydrolase [Bdellovibrionota bacterium]|nr:family 1 glycosylhydrolase [Bdellovibrionota bacterium]